MQTPSRARANPNRRLMPLICLLVFLALPMASAFCATGSLETAAVMAPLDIPNDAEMQAFAELLAEAKAAGVDTVSVDV